MENSVPLILPRMPTCVSAKALTRNTYNFDKLFPIADIIDCTAMPQDAQMGAVLEYMNYYKGRKTRPKPVPAGKNWRQKRMYDRGRRDYYLAALCDGDPDMVQKALYTANWNECMHQSNLIIVSNPDISDEFFGVTITDNYSIRYDYTVAETRETANIIVLPKTILSALDDETRIKLVRGFASIKFLACHDDGHSILGNYGSHEELLRAATAGLFKQMPEDFRKNVVHLAVKCLQRLEKADFPTRKQKMKQTRFWHGAFVYALQYLFDFSDPLMKPFLDTLKSQGPNLLSEGSSYAANLLAEIQSQLDRDEPELIHDPEQQQKGIRLLKDRLNGLAEITEPLIRTTTFLPVNTQQGTIFLLRRRQPSARPSSIKSLASAAAIRSTSELPGRTVSINGFRLFI